MCTFGGYTVSCNEMYHITMSKPIIPSRHFFGQALVLLQNFLSCPLLSESPLSLSISALLMDNPVLQYPEDSFLSPGARHSCSSHVMLYFILHIRSYLICNCVLVCFYTSWHAVASMLYRTRCFHVFTLFIHANRLSHF